MGKSLSEMTLEELWQLFPIFLTEHQSCWVKWFEDEKNDLKSLLPDEFCIHHIGSTAIDGIWAKPIIDILIEIPVSSSLIDAKNLLVSKGYTCMSESDNRMSFNKGYTENGFAEKVFHIHLRYQGDHDEVMFRDFLNVNPDKAKEYERLKLRLWKQFEHDRDGYTKAKSEFVAECMRMAASKK